MRQLVLAGLMVVVGCGATKTFPSICDDNPAPVACEQICDPSPSAASSCPGGFHCNPDGSCDAQCTFSGGQCGEGYTCTRDGRCIDDGSNGSGTGSGENFDSCKHIDLVISVDNSSSMSEEKQALRDIAFPGFANALINVGGGVDDFRVGVLDACPMPANYHTRGVGGQCNFQSGLPWIESSSSNLVNEFKCVGDIFSGDSTCSGSNDDEQPVTAATLSLEAAYQAAGKPNAGFARANALLVVLAITDEDEQPTPNASAQQIYARLVAANGGDVKRMVFVGIGGASACNGVYGSAKEATKLREVTDLFIAQGRGVWWDLCQGNLDQGLTQALTTIDTACNDFGPIL